MGLLDLVLHVHVYLCGLLTCVCVNELLILFVSGKYLCSIVNLSIDLLQNFVSHVTQYVRAVILFLNACQHVKAKKIILCLGQRS